MPRTVVSRPSRGHAAFTLVELLVVMAIIGLLIAALLPTLTKAREAARVALCLSNQRQLVLGLNMYADMYHDHLPICPRWTLRLAMVGTDQSPRHLGGPYREGLVGGGIMHCPDFRLREVSSSNWPTHRRKSRAAFDANEFWNNSKFLADYPMPCAVRNNGDARPMYGWSYRREHLLMGEPGANARFSGIILAEWFPFFDRGQISPYFHGDDKMNLAYLGGDARTVVDWRGRPYAGYGTGLGSGKLFNDRPYMGFWFYWRTQGND